MTDFGIYEGETCKRHGCTGLIEHRDVENCSCHISPPCSACTSPRAYCSECGWDQRDDEKMNGFVGTHVPNKPVIWERRKLDPTKIDWHSKSHTHFSMVKEGVYPEGTDKEEVRKLVNGTFGGQFAHFGGGTFKFIAYTD